VNLIEAIKSGRRFKRRCWPESDWLAPISEPENSGMSVSRVLRNEIFKSTIIVAELLADDWEVESQAVTITREQFEAAWREAIGWNEPFGALAFDAVAKELGL